MKWFKRGIKEMRWFDWAVVAIAAILFIIFNVMVWDHLHWLEGML